MRCTRVLTYEARNFLPQVGDVVPCCRHGYCAVEGVGLHGGGGAGGRSFPRAAPRSQSELLEWLRQRPETSVSVLRRERFTLRMIADAERDGLVELDLRAGRVALHPLARAHVEHGCDRKARS